MKTTQQHFRSQSNPRQGGSGQVLNPNQGGVQLKKSNLQQMMAIAGLNQTFYHKAQEQVVMLQGKKAKQTKNSQRQVNSIGGTQGTASGKLTKYNTQTIQINPHGGNSVIKSRMRNQTMAEADLIHQNWLNQTLNGGFNPSQNNSHNQGHLEGGSSGGFIENNSISQNPKYLNYINGDNQPVSSMKRQSSKAQQLLFQQQARAKSTLAKNENLIYNNVNVGRNPHQHMVSDGGTHGGILLSENNSQAQTIPYQAANTYQTYQIGAPMQIGPSQPSTAKRIKKSNNHSIGLIDNKDLNQYLTGDHHVTFGEHQHRGQMMTIMGGGPYPHIKGQLIGGGHQEMRMNQTIDAYSNPGGKQNQTIMIDLSKKKVLIAANTNLNTLTRRETNIGPKGRQQMMYNKERARSQLRQIVINGQAQQINGGGTKMNNFLGDQLNHPYSRQIHNYSPIHNNYLFHKRSESVNTQRPDSNYKGGNSQHQQQQQYATQYQNGYQNQKKKNINFTINQIKIAPAANNKHHRVQSSKRQRPSQVAQEDDSHNYIATNSNFSDKSSILGDYGGTNPVQNPSNSQTRKAAKGGTHINGQIAMESRFNQNANHTAHVIDTDSGLISKISQHSYKNTNSQSITGVQQQPHQRKDSSNARLIVSDKPSQNQIVGIQRNILKDKQSLFIDKKQTTVPNGKGIIHQDSNTINIIKEFDLNQSSSDYGHEEDDRHFNGKDSYSGASIEDEDDQEVDEIEVPNIQLTNEPSSTQTILQHNQPGKPSLFFDFDTMVSDEHTHALTLPTNGNALNATADPIYIQDDGGNQSHQQKPRQSKPKTGNANRQQFEIFESSSDDELSQGAFESAAQSFQKREKDGGNANLNGSREREQRMKDKQRRADRKKQEKLKKKKDQERQQKKDLKLKELRKGTLNLLPGAAYQDDVYQDDLLNFKDTDRESIISYLEKEVVNQYVVDTPTRLVNESNEFLEIQLKKEQTKIDKEELENTKENDDDDKSQISDRKKHQVRKADLLKIMGDQEMNLKQISDKIHSKINSRPQKLNNQPSSMPQQRQASNKRQ